jgi:hypothetical protein
MKKGRSSTGLRSFIARSWWALRWWVSSWADLCIASSVGGRGRWEFAPVADLVGVIYSDSAPEQRKRRRTWPPLLPG